MQNDGKGKNAVVIALLNQSQAFESYNEVFSKFGLLARVTEAESVGLMPFSTIPPRNSRDRANAKMLVPADAALGLRFSPVDLSPSVTKQ
jgi:hypothetical protein